MRRIIFFILFSGLFFDVAAQPVITLQEAVNIALTNNYNIRIAKNTSAISANNDNYANAGMLPTLNANAASNGSLQNTKQTQSDGSIREVDNARNSNSSAGVTLNWTFFDGFAMFAIKDQLEELKKLDETAVRSNILNTVSDVINGYYNLVKLQEEMAATDTAMTISQLRFRTAENRYKIGKASKLEVLTAKVDLNTDTTNLLRQRDALRSAKISFNVLLARAPETDFSVKDRIKVDKGLNFSELYEMASAQNPDLQTAFINERIARLKLKETKAARLPVLGLSSGYTFTRSHSELGFARDSRGQGFTYGVTASMNIFNGFLQGRREKNAGIEIKNAQLLIEQQKQNISAQLLSAYQTYKTSLDLIKLERSNREAARETMDITLAKFKLGSVTPVEFREAQQNYINASLRYTDAQYQAKIAEIALRELAGKVEVE